MLDCIDCTILICLVRLVLNLILWSPIRSNCTAMGYGSHYDNECIICVMLYDLGICYSIKIMALPIVQTVQNVE